MIAVIDYGAGNVGSVLKATQYLGYSAWRADGAELLERAQKVILPGQGHFGAMMEALSQRDILEPLRKLLDAGKPFLGICLGLQALYERSDEAPEIPGLGLLPGRVQRLKGVFKVPHVGWSQLEIKNPTRLLQGVPPGSFVYYCHSYYGPVTGQSAAVTEYGTRFCAAAELATPVPLARPAGAVWPCNVYAVQFHPEKSGDVGLKILKNFLEV